MNTGLASALSSSLAVATDVRDVGAALASVLAETWAAEVVVWLPRSDEGTVREEDLAVSGETLRSCPPAELCQLVGGCRIDRWLAAHGLPESRMVDLPPAHLGRIVVAWNRPDAVPAGSDDALGLVAGQASLILERRHLEDRLTAASSALLEADDQILRTRRVRALGEMASGVVHDFNNCLTSILGFTEIALGPLDEGDAFYNDLNGIRTSALDAAALVRRLQSCGRLGSDKNEQELVDLCDVARLMPTLARPRWMQAGQRHNVSFEVIVDARPVPTVHVIVAEIRELLLNLIFNAVDAMPEGGRITIATYPADDGSAVVSVSDEGVGMSKDVQHRIFQPFFSTKGDQGSGLGLSVCQTIAARHRGRLSVESTPGSGATFTLTLPAASPALVADPRPRRSRAAMGYATQQRVLFVDDQEEVRASVGEMLRAMGHHVTVVDRGAAAVSLVGRQRIDVVITDLGMPGMTGLDVAERFRLLAPRVPIVLLTGWGLDPDAARPDNVAFVLGKPVTMKSLDDAISACLAAPAAGNWSEKCS
jgi:signal transduction histidine kinase